MDFLEIAISLEDFIHPILFQENQRFLDGLFLYFFERGAFGDQFFHRVCRLPDLLEYGISRIVGVNTVFAAFQFFQFEFFVLFNSQFLRILISVKMG